VAIGVTSQSLGVLGVGLNVLADAAGSAMLVWRFRHEIDFPERHARSEQLASAVVATALAVVAIVLTVQAVVALLNGSRPNSSLLTAGPAGANVAVLVPLGLAKRRAGTALQSRALLGDATLSLIGGILAAVALFGLLVNAALGWWWADRAAALVAAAIAALESRRLVIGRRRGAV